MSTKARTSPRKNIWSTKTQSPSVHLGQEGASASSGVPYEDSASPGVSGTPKASKVEVGDMVIARWLTDKRWYVATVKNLLKSGR